MKVIQYRFAASCLLAAIALHACGGGSSNASNPSVASTPAPVSIATPAAFTASSIVPVVAAPLAAPLPANADYSGSIEFGAAASAVPADTTISETLTNIAPPTVSAPTLSGVARMILSQRTMAAAGDAIVVLAYVELLFSASITYVAMPSFRLTVPSNEITAASYFIAAYDPTRPSLDWQIGFEGPAAVRDSTLSFIGAAAPFTFAADTKYYFAVYAISTAAETPTPAPSIAPIITTPAPSVSATSTPRATPTPTATATTTPMATPTPTPTGSGSGTIIIR